jgi:hypothetical protein
MGGARVTLPIIAASDLLSVPNSDGDDQRIGSISFIGFTPRARANATMLVGFWDESPEAASRLEIPGEIRACLESLGVRSDR